mmetsp:Transcript_30690/g.91867  ORF Transcript_30690/g.91867 Transcript_30690/m.91867 type:complete len:366 (-) Transcript_30690:893-1990(-)
MQDTSMPSPWKDSRGASDSANARRTRSFIPPASAAPSLPFAFPPPRDPTPNERNPDRRLISRANPGARAAVVPLKSRLCRYARFGGGGGTAAFGQNGNVDGSARASNSTSHDGGTTDGLSAKLIYSGHADPPHHSRANPGMRPRRSRSDRREFDTSNREIRGWMFMASPSPSVSPRPDRFVPDRSISRRVTLYKKTRDRSRPNLDGNVSSAPSRRRFRIDNVRKTRLNGRQDRASNTRDDRTDRPDPADDLDAPPPPPPPVRVSARSSASRQRNGWQERAPDSTGLPPPADDLDAPPPPPPSPASRASASSTASRHFGPDGMFDTNGRGGCCRSIAAEMRGGPPLDNGPTTAASPDRINVASAAE